MSQRGMVGVPPPNTERIGPLSMKGGMNRRWDQWTLSQARRWRITGELVRRISLIAWPQQKAASSFFARPIVGWSSSCLGKEKCVSQGRIARFPRDSIFSGYCLSTARDPGYCASLKTTGGGKFRRNVKSWACTRKGVRAPFLRSGPQTRPPSPDEPAVLVILRSKGAMECRFFVGHHEKMSG